MVVMAFSNIITTLLGTESPRCRADKNVPFKGATHLLAVISSRRALTPADSSQQSLTYLLEYFGPSIYDCRYSVLGSKP